MKITEKPGTVEDVLKRVTDGLRQVLPEDKDFIPLHEPSFEGNELKYVSECVETGWVSSVGKFVDQFENDLAEFCGSKRAVAVVNGTAALHICLKLAGVRPGDEVISPTLTFIATANAISYCHAIPNFVDSSWETLGVDPQKLELYLKDIVEFKEGTPYNRFTQRRIGAIVVMHTFGHPCDMDAIMETANRYNIPVVEDAAESLGSYYKGEHTGNRGLISSLSFNGNKTITTGGGGAILTNDKEIGKRAKHITTTAKVPHKWAFIHDEVGYNYRMPNLNAALGCAQLEHLPEYIRRKRILAEKYRDIFDSIPGVEFFTEPDFARSNYWLNTLILDKDMPGLREPLLESTNESGIMTRPVWKLMHSLPMYEHCPKAETTTAEDIEKRLINIPSSPNLVI